MSKALIINFEDSEESLYKWLVNQQNYESVIKRLIDDEIKITEIVKGEKKSEGNNSNEKTKELNYGYDITIEDLDKISRKAKELFK